MSETEKAVEARRKEIESTEFQARQPIDTALSACREFQSGQTGFVHHNYAPYDAERADTIPVYENVCFALTLMRRRVADTIQEGRDLLAKILEFESDSGFPTYLHEYPRCRSQHLGVHLLQPLFWIVKDFTKILGEELKPRLMKAIDAMLSNALERAGDETLPYLIRFKYAQALRAWGSLLERPELSEAGEKLNTQLKQLGIQHEWCSSQNLGEMMAALALVSPDLSKSDWEQWWQFVVKTYHKPTLSYCGPAREERQKGDEPQSSLYDLFMGHYARQYSRRSFEVHPYQLQAALIPDVQVELPEIKYPMIEMAMVGEEQFLTVQMPQWAYSALQQKQVPDPTWIRRHHPFRLVWGDRTRTHTAVMQGGNAKLIDLVPIEPGHLELFIELTGEEGLRDDTQDCILYIDDHEQLKKNIAGKLTSTFQLGEEVRLLAEGIAINVAFDLHPVNPLPETAQMFGHIHLGNRPAQTALRGPDRFKAFDCSIFLRPVRRPEPVTLRVRIKIATR